MSIEQNLYDIIHARWGKDVRQSIHDGIEQCYTDGRAGATDLTAREAIASEVATRTNETHKQTATSTDFDLVTADGGIEVERVVGKSFKSANLATITNGSVTNHGITSSLANGVLNLSGTADSTWAQVGKSGSFNDISISSGKTVTVSINKTLDFNLILRFKTTDGSDFDIAINKGTTSTTKTLTNGVTTYYYFISGLTSGTTYSASNVSIMLNEGSTALPYIPYGIHSSGQYGCVDLSEVEYSTYDTSYPSVFAISSSSLNSIVNPKGFCSEYPYLGNGYRSALSNVSKGFISAKDGRTFYFKDTRFTNNNDFINANKGTLLSYEYSSTPSQYAEVWEEHGNDFDGEVSQGYWNTSFVSSNSYVSNTNIIPCKSGDVVKVEYEVTAYRIFAQWYNNGTFVSQTMASNSNEYSITIPSGANGYRFVIQEINGTNLVANFKNTIVSVGKKTIIFPLAEPLYKDNVVSDEGLVKTWNGINLEDISWVYESSNRFNGTFTKNQPYIPFENGRYVNDSICDKYSMKTDGSDKTFFFYLRNGVFSIFLYDASLTSTDTPSGKLVYPLATPTTQPLTADQLNALNSWKSFAGKTIITSQDLADAKPTVTLNYGKSDAMAKALEGACEAKRVDATEPNNEAIADAYNPKTTYVAGDYFISQDCLYKVKVGCQGIQPPNSTYYELTSVGKELRGSNILKDTVDIASFKSANPYICPCEGYFQVINTSGSALGYVVSNDLTGGAITIGGAVGRFSVYVRKGMKLYNDATAATYSRFVPFK